MYIHSEKIKLISLLYLYIPLFLFAFGWTKPVIALLCTAAAGYYLYQVIKNIKQSQQGVHVSVPVFILALLLFMWIGYYAGWGRWVAQTGDWAKHNAVLFDLVNRSWPVYYQNDTEHSMLVYYVAQYLVPAFVGKLLHSTRAAEELVFVWNILGMVLVYLNILTFLKTKNRMMEAAGAALLPVFGLPLWLAHYVLKCRMHINNIGECQWFYWGDGIMLQFTNHFTMLQWVFPQSIPIWLTVLLLMNHKEKIKEYVPMLLPSLLFGAFGFVGIVVLALGAVIQAAIREKSQIKQVFSIGNVSTLLTFGAVFFFYYYGNVTGDKPDSMKLTKMEYGAGRWWLYLIFVGIHVGIYAVLLWKENRTNGIYYAAILTLFFVPLYKMGIYNDFTMRVSIPGIFVVFLLSLQLLNNQIKKGTMRALLTAGLLMIGIYYPFHQISEAVKQSEFGKLGTLSGADTLEDFANREQSDWVDMTYNYYAYDIEDNFFYNYIARKK